MASMLLTPVATGRGVVSRPLGPPAGVSVPLPQLSRPQSRGRRMARIIRQAKAPSRDTSSDARQRVRQRADRVLLAVGLLAAVIARPSPDQQPSSGEDCDKGAGDEAGHGRTVGQPSASPPEDVDVSGQETEHSATATGQSTMAQPKMPQAFYQFGSTSAWCLRQRRARPFPRGWAVAVPAGAPDAEQAADHAEPGTSDGTACAPLSQIEAILASRQEVAMQEAAQRQELVQLMQSASQPRPPRTQGVSYSRPTHANGTKPRQQPQQGAKTNVGSEAMKPSHNAHTPWKTSARVRRLQGAGLAAGDPVSASEGMRDAPVPGSGARNDTSHPSASGPWKTSARLAKHRKTHSSE